MLSKEQIQNILDNLFDNRVDSIEKKSINELEELININREMEILKNSLDEFAENYSFSSSQDGEKENNLISNLSTTSKFHKQILDLNKEVTQNRNDKSIDPSKSARKSRNPEN